MTNEPLTKVWNTACSGVSARYDFYEEAEVSVYFFFYDKNPGYIFGDTKPCYFFRRRYQESL